MCQPEVSIFNWKACKDERETFQSVALVLAIEISLRFQVRGLLEVNQVLCVYVVCKSAI